MAGLISLLVMLALSGSSTLADVIGSTRDGNEIEIRNLLRKTGADLTKRLSNVFYKPASKISQANKPFRKPPQEEYESDAMKTLEEKLDAQNSRFDSLGDSGNGMYKIRDSLLIYETAYYIPAKEIKPKRIRKSTQESARSVAEVKTTQRVAALCLNHELQIKANQYGP